MPADLPMLLSDLAAETRVLDEILDPLEPEDWQRPTPSPGWSVLDQVTHLAYFDETAALAATDPDQFRADAARLTALGPGFPDEIAGRYRQLPAPAMLSWFREARLGFLAVFRGMRAADRLPWYGPDMSAASSVTARLMETWAHGQDVADALGVQRRPTARLRHVADLGYRTLGFSFRLNGLETPRRPVQVALTAPDGSAWTWGPDSALDSVTGPALDFCLAVTQRRHLSDTSLQVSGPVAAQWMAIAQAFAGAPGPGREPGSFFAPAPPAPPDLGAPAAPPAPRDPGAQPGAAGRPPAPEGAPP